MGILNIASKEKMEELILLQQIRDLASHGEDSFVYEDNELLTKMFNNREAMNNTVSGSRLFKYGVSKGLHAGKALALIDDIGIADWASLSTPEDILNDSSAFNEVFANTRAFKYMRSTGLLEYIPIDYIESNGAQYIKTGWMYGSTNYTGCKIRFESELGLSDGKIWVVTGCGSGTNLYVGLNQSNKIYYGNGGSDVDTGVTYNGNKCIFELDLKNKTLTVTDSVSGTVYVNASNITLATPSRTSQEFFLFAYSNTSDQAMMHAEKLYMYQIYENDTLVRDFVPAKDFNGVICLYDKVTKQFFYNAGTGDFLYDHTHDYGDTWLYNETHHWKACTCGDKDGLDIHSDANTDGVCDICGHKMYTPVQYITLEDGAVIDTGILGTNTQTYMIDFEIYHAPSGKVNSYLMASTDDVYTDYCAGITFSTSVKKAYVKFNGLNRNTSYNVSSDFSYNTWSDRMTATQNLDTGVCMVNGEEVTSYQATLIDTVCDTNVIIGGYVSNGEIICSNVDTDIRIYESAIYDVDNNVLANLIPVKDLAGNACLYDKVSGEFLYNANTTSGTISASDQV